jgi:hypothetical protein
MPSLGHPPPRELYVPLLEWSVQLQQQKGLLDVEDLGHRLYGSRDRGGSGGDRRELRRRLDRLGDVTY